VWIDDKTPCFSYLFGYTKYWDDRIWQEIYISVIIAEV